MAKRSKFIDRDRGYKKIMKEIKERKPVVAVGILGSEASATHSESGRSVVEIATVHEFGTDRVPQRSFIRSTVDEKKSTITKVARKAADQALIQKISTRKALETLGVFVVGQIKKQIAGRIPPPLAASTIARKGSSTPLIDTGQLRSSITHDVRTKNSAG